MLQKPDIFPSLWAGGGLGFPPKFVCLHLAKPPFSALSALSLTLVLRLLNAEFSSQMNEGVLLNYPDFFPVS